MFYYCMIVLIVSDNFIMRFRLFNQTSVQLSDFRIFGKFDRPEDIGRKDPLLLSKVFAVFSRGLNKNP